MNSVYGKCLENVRAYKSVKVISSTAKALKNINKIQFSSYVILDDELVTLELIKSDVKLNKPIYVGTVSINNVYMQYDCIYDSINI